MPAGDRHLISADRGGKIKLPAGHGKKISEAANIALNLVGGTQGGRTADQTEPQNRAEGQQPAQNGAGGGGKLQPREMETGRIMSKTNETGTGINGNGGITAAK